MKGPDFEVRTPDWLSPSEALQRILSQSGRLEPEVVSLQDAVGRALSENQFARATLPPWDNSAMDGYAVVASDLAGATPSTPRALLVTRAIYAGDPPGDPIAPGEAVRIMTGAPIPPGADSVVRVEDTDAETKTGTVQVLSDRDATRNIRPAGEDMQLGDLVLQAGESVSAGTVAALASLGLDAVSVVRRPTVSILATGDELRTANRYDEVRAGAGVPESNGPMLAAAARGASAVPLRTEIVPDDPDLLRARIEAAADADVLVTIGGASMGEADLVKRVLDQVGFRQDFWRVRMRPGSPFGFGWLPREGRDQAVFSLPGNPVSAFVTFDLFVRPYLLTLGGHKRVLRRTIQCRAGERLSGPAALTYFSRVTLDDSTVPATARLAGPQGSGLVRSLSSAEGFAIIPEAQKEVVAGDLVDVMLIDATPGAVAFGG